MDDNNSVGWVVEYPEPFFKSHGVPLIMGEFQYAPNLVSYIKIKIDEARKNEMFGDGKEVGTPYYPTGSQIFETMENITESLAVRIGIIDLYPLSTREINNDKEEIFIPNIQILKNKKPVKYEFLDNVFERIFKGSYPELYGNDKDCFRAIFLILYKNIH